MKSTFRVAIVALTLTTACLAQESLVTIRSRGGQKCPPGEVDKIYLSAYSAVREEFGGKGAAGTRATLVLGADKNGVDFEKREIWLVRWDRDFFAQGVVVLAFSDLMPTERRMAVAKRALGWVEPTIDAAQAGK